MWDLERWWCTGTGSVYITETGRGTATYQHRRAIWPPSISHFPFREGKAVVVLIWLQHYNMSCWSLIYQTFNPETLCNRYCLYQSTRLMLLTRIKTTFDFVQYVVYERLQIQRFDFQPILFWKNSNKYKIQSHKIYFNFSCVC